MELPSKNWLGKCSLGLLRHDGNSEWKRVKKKPRGCSMVKDLLLVSGWNMLMLNLCFVITGCSQTTKPFFPFCQASHCTSVAVVRRPEEHSRPFKLDLISILMPYPLMREAISLLQVTTKGRFWCTKYIRLWNWMFEIYSFVFKTFFFHFQPWLAPVAGTVWTKLI